MKLLLWPTKNIFLFLYTCFHILAKSLYTTCVSLISTPPPHTHSLISSICFPLLPFKSFLSLPYLPEACLFCWLSFLLTFSIRTVIFLSFLYSQPWTWTSIPVSLKRFIVGCFDVSHIPKSLISFPKTPIQLSVGTLLESRYKSIMNVSLTAVRGTSHQTLFIILLKGDWSLAICHLSPRRQSACLWSSFPLGSRARERGEARLTGFEHVSGFMVQTSCNFPKPHKVAEIIIFTSWGW